MNKPYKDLYPEGDDVNYFHIVSGSLGLRVVSSITDYRMLSGYITRDSTGVCKKLPGGSFNALADD